MTQGQSEARLEPSGVPAPAGAPPPRSGDRVHPGIVVLVVLAIIAAGAGAYFFTQSGTSSKSDQARVDAAILRVEDLPSGFSTASSSSSSSSSDDPAKQDANRCLTEGTGLSSDAQDKDRTAKSTAKFESSSAAGKVTVNAEAEVYGNLDIAVRTLHLLSDTVVGGCIQRLFQDSFAQEGVTVSDYHQIPVDLAALGDDRGGFGAQMTITGSTGKTAQLSFVTAVVKVGHTFVSMVVTDINGAAPSTLIADGLTTMVSRAR
jgi:hypothetical protein